jgi:uncharacterized LabA/DUF88 family protein
MEKGAIMFIDGNNWYHNAKHITNPKDLDFNKIANLICKNFNLNLIQIRYYNSVPDISENPLKYHQHMDFLNDLEKHEIKVFTRKLQKTSTKDILREKAQVVDSLDLCRICKPLIRQNCLDCVGIINKKEKGIDVKIAIDMIRKCLIEKECDVCILISGDADFIPAMQTIKDAGKEVITASVPPGYSNELRSGKFRYLYLTRSDLNRNCVKDYSKKT